MIWSKIGRLASSLGITRRRLGCVRLAARPLVHHRVEIHIIRPLQRPRHLFDERELISVPRLRHKRKLQQHVSILYLPDYGRCIATIPHPRKNLPRHIFRPMLHQLKQFFVGRLSLAQLGVLALQCLCMSLALRRCLVDAIQPFATAVRALWSCSVTLRQESVFLVFSALTQPTLTLLIVFGYFCVLLSCDVYMHRKLPPRASDEREAMSAHRSGLAPLPVLAEAAVGDGERLGGPVGWCS